MKEIEKWPLLYRGLNQLETERLKRLQFRLCDGGEPIIFDGSIGHIKDGKVVDY